VNILSWKSLSAAVVVSSTQQHHPHVTEKKIHIQWLNQTYSLKKRTKLVESS
jgi:hypothetical protein